MEVRLDTRQLAKPYALSFRTLEVFEAVVVRVTMSDGQRFNGEVVPLPGYGEENVDDVLVSLSEWEDTLVGSEPRGARAFLNVRVREVPFAASAVLGALDQAAMLRNPSVSKRSVPVVYPVSSNAPNAEDDIRTALDQGYGTLKIKVGFGLEKDLFMVSMLERITPPSVKLRFDANAALTPDLARTFCEAVAEGLGEQTELVEQPFPVDMWEETAALAAATRLPIMLDEAILGMGDVERAAAVGARAIKLKLCKQGSVPTVLRYARRARRLGLAVVFGNGVATDISNQLELWTAARFPSLFAGASEANGFCKLREPLQFHDLAIHCGDARW